MKLRITLFAGARELANSQSIAVEVAEPADAGSVLAAIGESVPQLAPMLPACRLAVDNQYLADDASVSADHDVALIPPVSGG